MTLTVPGSTPNQRTISFFEKIESVIIRVARREEACIMTL